MGVFCDYFQLWGNEELVSMNSWVNQNGEQDVVPSSVVSLIETFDSGSVAIIPNGSNLYYALYRYKNQYETAANLWSCMKMLCNDMGLINMLNNPFYLTLGVYRESYQIQVDKEFLGEFDERKSGLSEFRSTSYFDSNRHFWTLVAHQGDCAIQISTDGEMKKDCIDTEKLFLKIASKNYDDRIDKSTLATWINKITNNKFRILKEWN